MALDVSEAIALAKDLLQTSNDFRPHDPDMAREFSDRAYEICSDLGIDRSLIGGSSAPLIDAAELADDTGEDEAEAEDADEELTLSDFEDNARDTSEQLRELLQQQALVLQNARRTVSTPEPKAERRFFGLFGRPQTEDAVELQSA